MLKSNMMSVHQTSLQIQQARLESEEYCLKLEVVQKEAWEVQVSLEREKEQVRRELLGWLRELETLPDRLRKTEQQLQNVQQEANAHKRRNMENNAAFSEVRHKVDVLHVRGKILNVFMRKVSSIIPQHDRISA